MNATLSSIRRLRPRRSTRLRLSSFFGILCVAVLATAPGTAQADYTFTPIADSTGPFSSFGIPPTLNATGTAAFFASLDNGSSGVFKGNGGIVTTIGVNALPFGGNTFPTINQAGTVAFAAFEWNGVEQRILAGNGGPLITIADIAGPFRDFSGGYSTSINTSGAVAFKASLDVGPGGIFVSNAGIVTQVFTNSASLSTSGSISINDAGTIAFRRGIGTAIYTVNGGLITTIADSSGPFNYFSIPTSINNAGTVAFGAGVGGADGGVFGIYKGNGGPLTTIADISGPFSYLGDFGFQTASSINDAGMVAFNAALDIGGGGVFVGDGIFTNKVIGAGDPLFGSTVIGAGVSPTSLNNNGQVAFAYTLANGTTGIAIANPVPEPSTAALLGAAMAALGFSRRRQR